MNSVGSNHSTNRRSMSIISLGLPRNSIVSIDDTFLRPTRNNSNTSLTSLSAGASPGDFSRDHYTIGNSLNRHVVMRRNTNAVVSDEESEGEHTVSRLRWRRRSSEKVQKPSFLSSLKKDFKFQYDRDVKPKLASPAKAVEDSTPLPLSLAHEHADHDDDRKKLRTSSISHSMYLKKKLLLSKDIQIELLGHASSPPTASSETRFPFPTLPLPSPTRGAIHNYLSSHEGALPSRSSPLPPLPASLLPLPTHVPLSAESSLRQQNKLIYELNRKWNKAMFTLSDRREERDAPLRKRGRSELVSSSDS